MRKQPVIIRSRVSASVVCAMVTLLAQANISWAQLAVQSVSPAPRSLAAPVNAPIVIQFDKAIDISSINTGRDFWAFGRWSGMAGGQITLSNGGSTATLTPDNSFSAGENVMVILSHNVKATDGSTLRSQGYSYQFWTAARPSPMALQEIGRMTTVSAAGPSTRSYGGFASDLNHDGFLDVSIVNEDTADIRVFMNLAQGDGAFAPFAEPTYAVGNRASPSEPADFNFDGHTDICVANINDSTVSVLLGNGDGTFATQTTIATSNAPRGIVVLDVDGDGDMDIVNTCAIGNNFNVHFNNGLGAFGTTFTYEGGGTGEFALAAGDMDEDGLIDLVIGMQNEPKIVIQKNNGNGTFTLAGSSTIGATGGAWMLNVGDVNGDGHEDVAVVNNSLDRGVMVQGDGTGLLGAAVLHGLDNFPLATDLGDLDGDGDLDWVTSSFFGDFFVFTNDGNGAFTFFQELLATQAASCVLLFDFDKDGDLDMGLIDELEDEVILISNSGTAAVEVPTVSTWSLAIMSLLVLVAGCLILRREQKIVSADHGQAVACLCHPSNSS